MFLLVQLVDTVFLAFAVDPHRSCWDQLIAVLIMAPVLLFIYQNSWSTILMTGLTAVASDLFMKWSLIRQRRASVREDDWDARLAMDTE